MGWQGVRDRSEKPAGQGIERGMTDRRLATPIEALG